jgi:hypothetical protein
LRNTWDQAKSTTENVGFFEAEIVLKLVHQKGLSQSVKLSQTAAISRDVLSHLEHALQDF